MRILCKLRTLTLLGAGLLATRWLAADPSLVCDEGRGSFSAVLPSGALVSVGAARAGGFARRACQAHLELKEQRIEVAANAVDIDADALNVDVGLETNVATFQIRQRTTDTARTYAIYSIKRPIHLLRTINGGEFYTAADTDLDGRVEIWTTDAAAFDGLDGLRLSAFDFAPPMALRYEHQKLLDVSAEFTADYDRRIATLRNAIEPVALAQFLQSDGRLAKLRPDQFDKLHNLLTTKVKTLEIVACYLWSGRDAEADRALNELWPAADRDRIRTWLVKARSQGVRSQVDAVSSGSAAPHHRTMVYQAHLEHEQRQLPVGLMGSTRAGINMTEAGDREPENAADVAPIAIQMTMPAPDEESAVRTMALQVKMRLLVDAAGKVREAHAVGGGHADLERAAFSWKFIPAQKDGKSVAAWSELSISFQR
jgi:hypothetical protein